MFFKKRPSSARREQLQQAELDLINNQFCLEHYSSNTEMLKKRVERLRAEVAADYSETADVARRADPNYFPASAPTPMDAKADTPFPALDAVGALPRAN